MCVCVCVKTCQESLCSRAPTRSCTHNLSIASPTPNPLHHHHATRGDVRGGVFQRRASRMSALCRCPAGGADSLSYPATCRHGLSRRSRGNERSHGVLDGQSVPVIPLSCRRPRRIRPSCVILPRKSLARIQPPPADRTSPVRIRDRSRFHAILMTHVSDFHGQRASADWVLHGYITDCLQTQFARVNSRFVFVLWLR